MHGHGGMLLEQLKLQRFHMDLQRRRPDVLLHHHRLDDVEFPGQLAAARGVPGAVRRQSGLSRSRTCCGSWPQDAGVSFFGASPTYVDLMAQAGIVPRSDHRPVRAADGDAGRLAGDRRMQGMVLPQRESGPVAGHRQRRHRCAARASSAGCRRCRCMPARSRRRHLGVAAYAFNERGEQVIDEVGELVITEPMPSMPVGFWDDTDGTRYRESYFDEFPGVWRQGDFFRVNARGGCFVLGRSDATLNRHGVRIGTAEIYAALASVEEVAGRAHRQSRPARRRLLHAVVRQAGRRPGTRPTRSGARSAIACASSTRHATSRTGHPGE